MIVLERFREVLWFRFNVFRIAIPPLRQRRKDTRPLLYRFIDRKPIELKLSKRPRLATGTINRLTAYDGPANLRVE